MAIAFVHIIPETARTYYLWVLSEENQLWDKTHPQRVYKIVDGMSREIIKELTQEQMTNVIEEILETKFPLPFVLVLMGYSMILLIDRVLIDSHDHQRVEHDDSSSNETMEARKPLLDSKDGKPDVIPPPARTKPEASA